MDDFVIGLGSFILGGLVGGAAVRYQSRADRRDAERFRRETAAALRADVKATSDYSRSRITLRNEGPADAVAVNVPDVGRGPRSIGALHGREEWPLPADIPAGASLELLLIHREGVGDWLDLTIEWTDADGTLRQRKQRINWAG